VDTPNQTPKPAPKHPNPRNPKSPPKKTHEKHPKYIEKPKYKANPKYIGKPELQERKEADARGTTHTGETPKLPEKTRILLEMPLERRVRGEKDPNIVDLALYLQKNPRPLVAAPTVRVSRNTMEIPTVRHVHWKENPNTIDLQPKNEKNQIATHTGEAAIHRNGDDGKDQSNPAKPRAGRVSAKEDPTTADLLPKRKEPKRRKKEEKTLGLNGKRKGGGGREERRGKPHLPPHWRYQRRNQEFLVERETWREVYKYTPQKNIFSNVDSHLKALLTHPKLHLTRISHQNTLSNQKKFMNNNLSWVRRFVLLSPLYSLLNISRDITGRLGISRKVTQWSGMRGC
jgi:hypothetical protein